MKTFQHLCCGLVLAALASGFAMAEDTDKNVDWDKAYEALLEKRPEIRRKVENGGATKEQVIEWMKKYGDKEAAAKKDKGKGKGRGGKDYYGAKVEVKDPADYKQEGKTLFSGPQPGEKLPSFKVVGLQGKRQGEEYDPVAAADGKPLILIFQDNQVVGQKGLLLNGKIFEQIAQNAPSGLEVHSVFLVDDPTPENVFEYDFKKQIASTVQMSVSRDRRDGPGAYGLNRNLAMTLIVARDGKVLHNFPMAQPLLYPNPYVLGAIADAVEAKPETLASWIRGGKGGAEMKNEKLAMAKEKAAQKKRDAVASAEATQRKKQADAAKDRAGKAKDATGTKEAAMDRRRRAERATDVPRRSRTIEVKDPAEFQSKTDKVIFSGPQPGEKLPTFKATSLFSEGKGDEVDVIKETGDKPQVLIFQDRSGVPIRGLFGVSDALNKIRREHKDLQMSVVFMDDDKEYITQFASRFADSLKDRGMTHVTVSADGRDGPGNYGLNRTIAQTIILAKDGKVTRNFVFPQGLLYADPHVMGGIAELIDVEREVVAKLVNTPNERERQAMMARDRAEANPRAGAQARFREKLAELVRAQKITRAEAGELWNAAFGPSEVETDRPAQRDRRMRDRDRPAGDRDTTRDRPQSRDRGKSRDRVRGDGDQKKTDKAAKSDKRDRD